MKKQLVLMSILATACLEEKDHCGEYVDYICECHEEDPGFDCDEQRSIYEESSLEQQNTCAITLDELQQEDQEEGTGCETEDSGEGEG